MKIKILTLIINFSIIGSIGMVIAASFLISIPIGIIISLSVAAQEIGDFAILLESGFSKRKSFLLNSVSSSTTIPSALIIYYILELILLL